MTDEPFVSRQSVQGHMQTDGSMLFVMDVPPTATSVVIQGIEFEVPPGASHIHVVLSTDDIGQTTLGIRPTYEGETDT